MTRDLGSVLLIVDDWEALERYEDRLTSISIEIEACPLSVEGLRRSGAQDWDWVILDLTSEDMTLREACDLRAVNNPSPWCLVGSADELSQIQSERLLRDTDRMMARPFDWELLFAKLRSDRN